jgi:hypothetical protein
MKMNPSTPPPDDAAESVIPGQLFVADPDYPQPCGTGDAALKEQLVDEDIITMPKRARLNSIPKDDMALSTTDIGKGGNADNSTSNDISRRKCGGGQRCSESDRQTLADESAETLCVRCAEIDTKSTDTDSCDRSSDSDSDCDCESNSNSDSDSDSDSDRDSNSDGDSDSNNSDAVEVCDVTRLCGNSGAENGDDISPPALDISSTECDLEEGEIIENNFLDE